MGVAKRIEVCTDHVGHYALTVLDCPQCGEVFGLQASLVDLRRRDGQSFCCPHGHSMSYPLGKSLQQRALEEAQRRAEVAEREAQRQRDAREWAEKQARGANIAASKAKAAHRRLQHRVECGVCPYCRRTLQQLAAHMKAKHGR